MAVQFYLHKQIPKISIHLMIYSFSLVFCNCQVKSFCTSLVFTFACHFKPKIFIIHKVIFFVLNVHFCKETYCNLLFSAAIWLGAVKLTAKNTKGACAFCITMKVYVLCFFVSISVCFYVCVIFAKEIKLKQECLL